MVTVSPAVSPSVVAAILIIQNESVTSGTLLNVSFISLRITLWRKDSIRARGRFCDASMFNLRPTGAHHSKVTQNCGRNCRLRISLFRGLPVHDANDALLEFARLLATSC